MWSFNYSKFFVSVLHVGLHSTSSLSDLDLFMSNFSFYYDPKMAFDLVNGHNHFSYALVAVSTGLYCELSSSIYMFRCAVQIALFTRLSSSQL